MGKVLGNGLANLNLTAFEDRSSLKAPLIEVCSKIYWQCFTYLLYAMSFIKRIMLCVRILKLDFFFFWPCKGIYLWRKDYPTHPLFLNQSSELFGIYLRCFCRDSSILGTLNPNTILGGFIVCEENNHWINNDLHYFLLLLQGIICSSGFRGQRTLLCLLTCPHLP